MKKILFYFISQFLMLIFLLNFKIYAEETKKTQELPEVIVIGERVVVPTKEAAETVYTGMEITKKGIEIRGQQGSSNIWSILNLLPGIVYESPDPANLATTQHALRVRGISGSLGTMSVEGIPIYGGNPIGPRAYILDAENFETIAVYKGIAPVELGTGVGTRGGVVELRPKWAKDKLEVEFSQAVGMFDYAKTYVRFDSGKITPLGTKFSISYSNTETDKWRGKGKLGPRNNVNLTFVQPLGERGNFKLWINYNDIFHHKYRSLSYNDTKGLDPKYRRLDYNTKFVGDPKKDWLYYKFYTLEWTNWDVFGFIDFKITPNLVLEIKPYYREEEKDDWSGSRRILGPGNQTKEGVQYTGWTTKRYGAISQLVFTYRNLQGLLGYHYQESEWIDVPGRNYWLNPNGTLTFVGWGRVIKSQGKSPMKSPFIKFSGNFGKFNWQVGLKYLETRDNKNIGYITKYNGTTPYLVREPLLDHGGRTYEAWLPFLGFSYTFSPNFEVYLSAGRTFQTPYMYMPIVNLYYNLYDKFKKLGITLDDLFKDFKPEKTDNVDFGLRVRTERFEFYPTLYLSKHKNLNTPFTPGWKDPDNSTELLRDPTTGKPVSFNTFIGKAKGYGIEVAAIYHLTKDVSFFLNPSYVKLEYEGDITSQGTTYKVDGKQVVNVPEKVLTAGMIGRWRGLEFVPMVRYVSKSYGNLAYTEKIPEYWVVDLKISYNIPEIRSLKIKDLRAGLEIYNLFDRRYYMPGYYPGAPFTVFGVLSFKF